MFSNASLHSQYSVVIVFSKCLNFHVSVTLCWLSFTAISRGSFRIKTFIALSILVYTIKIYWFILNCIQEGASIGIGVYGSRLISQSLNSMLLLLILL